VLRGSGHRGCRTDEGWSGEIGRGGKVVNKADGCGISTVVSCGCARKVSFERVRRVSVIVDESVVDREPLILKLLVVVDTKGRERI
jgi:hypothetical protein